MKTVEERALASWNERYPEGSELYRDAQIDGYIVGATEQKAIDEKRIAELEAKFDALVGLNEELCNTIDEYKKKRAADINKACEWFSNYLMEIGYPDDWMRDSEVQLSGEQRFRKEMEGWDNEIQTKEEA